MHIQTDLLFPTIEDNSDFIKTHPNLHPSSTAYEIYWKEELNRLIYGYWGEEKTKEGLKYRFIPPQLYYFINYHTMMVTKKKQRLKSRPFLWDINYTILNLWFIARGFSGFKDDLVYTSNYAVYLKEQSLITNLEVPLHILDTISEDCYTSTGDLKKYIDPLEYLNSTHKEKLGHPLYDNYASNLFLFGCHGEEVKIPLYKGGYKFAKDILIGDEIIGDDGTKRIVTNLHNGQAPLYRISSKYNESFTVTSAHTLCLNKHYKSGKIKEQGEYLLENLDFKKYKYSLITAPIKYPKNDLKIDPYFIGLWLGDGFKREKMIVVNPNKDIEILDWLKEYGNKVGRYSLKQSKNGLNDGFTTRVSIIFNDLLYKNNYWSKTFRNNKHIPYEYMYSSYEDRLQLLAGYIDSDGSFETGRYTITSVDLNLLKQTQQLAKSLGFKAVIHKPSNTGLTNSLKYNLRISGDITKIPVKLSYKKALNNTNKKGNNYNYIKIDDIKVDNFYGFDVDKNHKYILEDGIVTHNSRGGGKSFMASSVLEHEYLTDGAKTLEDFLAKKNKIEIFCGAPIASKSSDLLDKFKDSFDNLPGEYSDGREMFPAPFSRQSSGTLKVGNSKNPFRFQYEKKIGNTTKLVGTGTLLKHETFKDNKQAAVGGRYTVIVIEEVGLEDSLLTIHGANRSTQDLGEGKFGSSLYIGTSGDVDKVIETEIIFRDPEAYDFLAFPDIYEGRGKLGFFLPAYYTNAKFKDENGNTDVQRALEYEFYEREKAKKANNTVAYDELIMSRPIKPSEMFLSRTGNKFPIAMLREVQADNDRYEYKKHLRTVGHLIPDKDYIYGVKFKNDTDARPIDRFPHDAKSNLESAWEFYEHPPGGLIPPGLYKIVYDPIRDEGGGTSLAAIYVYKSNNTLEANGNEIVAWWVGRYDKPDDIHLQCVLAAKYFNAQVMFENNIIDFKNYCMRTGNYHILATTPKQIIEKAIKDPTLKYDVGIPMTTPLKEYALRLTQQWLLDEKKKYKEQLLDGTEREITVRNLNTLKDDLLIEELIQYNSKGNFDRVSALLLLMLWLEQDKELVIKESEDIVKKTSLDFYKDLHNNRLKNKVLINY
jgi:hypothetical protein